ncbi:ATP-binding protein [Paenibacillus sepulcri]|uniref:histidine kinase n=1 Tax=Paenibacillus sepulcri TaxID=359917 RepID=A0ABS7C392_9BACL|nr:HAMP domain-containing histidine kinase [Paenibacillus sepulcri]
MSSTGGIRFPIRHKLLLSFTVVIFAGLSALLLVSVRITEQNVSGIINQDMIQANKTIELYVKQYFLTRNISMDQDSIGFEADGLVKELSAAVGSPISVYDPAGKGLSDLNADLMPATNDFAESLHGKIAYSLRQSGTETTVRLSSPVESGGKLIGVIHMVKDYSGLYDFTSRFLSTVRWFAVGIFLLVFLTAALLAVRITKPLGKLARSLERVSEGIYETAPPALSRDEIGDLSRSFMIMVKQIKAQIAIIERERDTLQETQAMSKTFFDNVTHELKTPLTTIRGYAQIMMENGFTDPVFFNKGMKYILDESQRLNDKVVQIIEFSTAAAEGFDYRLEEVDLSNLVRDVCEDMRVKARKYGIRIDCADEPGLQLIGDEVKLREMLINVVDNAVKYGGVNTTIHVTAEQAADNRIRIRVEDQGPGIAEEHLHRLFDPFYRVAGTKKEERGSAGLGLAIVKTIAERHNGHVTIDSQLHQGSTVTIELGGHDHE